MSHVVICGGGNTAHALGLDLTRLGMSVSLYSRKAKKTKHDTEIIVIDKQFNRTEKWIAKTLSQDELMFKKVDFIFITNPIHDRPRVLTIINNNAGEKKIGIGAVPAWGGFDWMCHKYLKDVEYELFGLKDTPYITMGCRFGHSVVKLGTKKHLTIFTPSYSGDISKLLHTTFRIPLAHVNSMLSLTLTPGNPMEHIPILYSFFGPGGEFETKKPPENLTFYGHVPPGAERLMAAVDKEIFMILTAVAEKLPISKKFYKPLNEDLVYLYGNLITDPTSLGCVFTSNRAFSGIPLPLYKNKSGELKMDFNHRCFIEDVEYGLDLLSHIGTLMMVQTATMDALSQWIKTIRTGKVPSVPEYMPLDLKALRFATKFTTE